MRAPFPRAAKVPADVLARAGLPRGDKVLAHTQAADGSWLLGTRDALVLVPGDAAAASVRLPWEQVETADWDRDEERLRVAEVGEFGRPAHGARGARSPTRAGCSSWSASGSPRACCCSAGSCCRARARA